MSDGRPRATDGYAEQAATLAPQYDRQSFDDIYRNVLGWIPRGPGRALDIGAGTGRDAAVLAARGFRVTAVEPTREFRDFGRRVHADAGIDWLDDLLPALPRVRAQVESKGGERFDFILSMAVWMHLDPVERAEAMTTVAGLLAPGGRLILSLRHGPIPAGRRMFEVSAAEINRLAMALGLALRHCGTRADMMGRADVHWTFLVFESAA